MANLISLDLFCGAGGITEGFRQAGFRSVFANDFNRDAVASFSENHPGTEAVCDSIESLDPTKIRKSLGLVKGELDCLVGGPPCQGFSINAPIRVLEDPRNSLVRHYLRFVDAFQPKTLLIENVPGMVSLAGGRVLFEILERLEDLGYQSAYKILFAAHYGVPQERWRLIILASRVGEPPAHPLPQCDVSGRANFAGGRLLTFRPPYPMRAHLRPFVPVADAIGDLPPLESGEGSMCMPYLAPPASAFAKAMRKGSAQVRNHMAPKLAEVNLERLKHIQPGGSWRDIPFELLPKGMQQARSSDHTKRYGRLRPEGLAGTVMTKMDPHWGAAFHYNQDRALTVREAARLQSFPDRYTFTGPYGAQYEQVGNAVPVLMARVLAASIMDSLENTLSYGRQRRLIS